MSHHISTAPQWAVSEKDIAGIADGFGLTLRSSTAVPLGGAVNGVVRVTTDAGEVVLRVHRPWTTVDRLEGVHRVQDHLRSHGLPVPDVLVARSGHRWMWLHDRLAEAMPYVPGGAQADTWEEFAVSFVMLGRLHAALASLPPNSVSTSVPALAHGSFADPRTALSMLAETDPAFASCADRERYGEAAEIRCEVRALLRHLYLERASYEDSLPRSLIHADFLGTNVLIANGRVIAILDFDRLAWRERVHDLAVSLYCVLGRLHRAQPATEPPTPAELARLAGLVAIYEESAAAPLDPRELAALPFEMARVPLYPVAEAGYLAAAGDGPGAIAEILLVASHLPRATGRARSPRPSWPLGSFRVHAGLWKTPTVSTTPCRGAM